MSSPAGLPVAVQFLQPQHFRDHLAEPFSREGSGRSGASGAAVRDPPASIFWTTTSPSITNGRSRFSRASSSAGLKLDINLQNGIRVDRTDDEMLGLMQRAGVFKGGLWGRKRRSPRARARPTRWWIWERARKLTATAVRFGIVTHGFFIIGLPGDTPETMERTLRYAIEMNPHYANFSVCIPFPGTEIYEEIKQNGRFLKDVDNGVEAGYYSGRVYYELPGMDPRTAWPISKRCTAPFTCDRPSSPICSERCGRGGKSSG